MREGPAPFLKWPGGKRWLVPELKRRIGQVEGTYYEPFLGGAAAFFGLSPRRAVLADVNVQLIELYQAMKDSPDQLHKRLVAHQLKHDKAHYYATRASDPSERVDKAARMLYLNRTCFNGIWRVNRRGEFNVPMGSKSRVVFEDESFCDLAETLKNARLLTQDFEATICAAGPGDVVYADPPYTVAHNHNGFLKYNDEIFRWDDQVRLRDSVRAAAQRGVIALVSNANHESIRDLYAECARLDVLPRYSAIAGSAERRALTTELLISVDG